MGKKHIGNKNRHPETSRPARPACRFFLPPINKTKGLWMFSSRVNFLGRSGALAGAIALLASCGGGGGGGGAGGGVGLLPIVAPPPVVTHTVGGSVTGLVGALVLQNNAGDDLKLSDDGKFTFATRVTEGAAYEVSVRTQPLWQFCTVSKGSGKAAADVADVAVACSAAAAQVSTWAGSDTTGSADGHGTSATFETPIGLVVDKSGGLFVSDPINGLLRKISPTGDVSTFAGMAGTNGWQDGNGLAAQFNGLAGIALDISGNVFGAELGGRIRKITPAADVSTIAGDGTSGGSLDGHGTSAKFQGPTGVAVAADGTIYVSEVVGSVIRKITPAGDVTTFAGSGTAGFADGTGTAASFNQPFGIALDAAGNLYVADGLNNRIRRITPDGVVTTLAGSGAIGAADGPGGSASFAAPFGVAVGGDGNLYVADSGNSLLRRVTPAGVVSTLAGQPGVMGSQDGIGAAATLTQPYSLAMAADGTLYVADSLGHKIRKVSPVRAP
jgi:streptogramin lyase